MDPVKATHPKTGGIAPARPPMTMFCGPANFKILVYKKA